MLQPPWHEGQMKRWSSRLWWQVLSARGNCHFAVSGVHGAPSEALLNATAKISAGKKKILLSTGTFNLLVAVRPAFCYVESSRKTMGKVQIYLKIRFFFFHTEAVSKMKPFPVQGFSQMSHFSAFSIPWLALLFVLCETVGVFHDQNFPVSFPKSWAAGNFGRQIPISEKSCTAPV